MWRFVAVLVLAHAGMMWFLLFASVVQKAACLTAFGVAIMLPYVMNPTRHWRRAFFLCFDIVYAASCLGAYTAVARRPTSFAVFLASVSQLEVFIAGIVPAILFGTMASFGVGRSGLADLRK
jgi:hypothetical protein